MTNQDILSRVDHTLLAPTATWTAIEQICQDATTHGTASVCIPASFVAQAHQAFPSLNICTVVGFPLGYSTTPAKVQEIDTAIAQGANEIDMVINIGHAKMGRWDDIQAEITALKQACGERILKVIIETCYLSDDEKIKLCQIVSDSGADYIKTSTGFGTAGATPEDIALFKKHVAPHVKIKAAGGMSTYDDLVRFVELGADRLGTSKAVGILAGDTTQQGY